MKTFRQSYVLLPLLALVGCFTSATPPPIEIGHVSDKTRLDKAGEQAERGMRLALSELSKDDALAQLFGGRKVQIRITDTQGKTDAFESQAVRLDAVNRCVALFGGLSTAETVALSNAKIPLLTFSGQQASGAGNHVFYLGMSPGRQGAALAKVVGADARATRTTVLIDERRPEATVLADSFRKTLDDVRKEAKTEPAVVLALRFGKDAKWAELSERSKSHGANAIVFAGAVQDFNAWHKASAKARHNSAPLVVYAGDDGDHRLFDFEGDAKVSVVLASAFFADPASEKITAFTKAFHEAFQQEADVHAALAYDGLGIMVEAMKATSKQLTPEKLCEELLKTKDFDGLTGKLSFNADREVQRPLFVVRWQNGALSERKK